MSATRMFTRACALVLFSGGLLTLPKAALSADFFMGKTFRIIVGSTTGGGYDAYARLVARNIGRHIPGNPQVIVSNKPGAGGNIAAELVYNVAEKDGTVMGAVSAGSVLDKLIGDAKRIKHDPSKTQYIGSANGETLTCVVRSDAPVKTFDEARKMPVVLGVAGGTTRDMPTMLNNLLGTKFKLVSGYRGTRNVNLAIEKGEVQGICGMGWTSIQKQKADWFKPGGFARVLVQEALVAHPGISKLGAPLSLNYAKDNETREIMQMIYQQTVFTRPFMMAPQVPKERVEIVRAAFMKALKDTQTQAEAEKQQLVINAISGADLQERVRKIYAMDPKLHARAKKALGY
ncbi:MAG: tripartite tricarboxylate transporter substrate-binding protein [Beijerinckiaceae bacterium]|jgi:tripartite-type tricarboxylate transporter receptor subunit TctC|nr:tripartite tricarboxylate transporter substrate-binding protein [Beijerinckiaceae bacterium]